MESELPLFFDDGATGFSINGFSGMEDDAAACTLLQETSWNLGWMATDPLLPVIDSVYTSSPTSLDHSPPSFEAAAAPTGMRPVVLTTSPSSPSHNSSQPTHPAHLTPPPSMLAPGFFSHQQTPSTAGGPSLTKGQQYRLAKRAAAAVQIAAAPVVVPQSAQVTLACPRKRASALSEEERLLKLQERVLKNRESAQQSRDRKRQQVEQLEERVATLEARNQFLEAENARLQAENVALRKPTPTKASTGVAFVLLFSFGLLFAGSPLQQSTELQHSSSHSVVVPARGPVRQGRVLLSVDPEASSVPPAMETSTLVSLSTGLQSIAHFLPSNMSLEEQPTQSVLTLTLPTETMHFPEAPLENHVDDLRTSATHLVIKCQVLSAEVVAGSPAPVVIPVPAGQAHI
eukprot:TRINITY_DN445_c0_g1_i1.p1 TRINITY_DN445_c0_g1~~TRINITY_DN445_c0_g1_i1.p1  ORF type:complete len:402 (-),score=90.03 TRINITY_DN445_c0_g1_i1:81-1286(-)